MPNRIDPNSVRQRLKVLRLERGLTQDAIAERAEISSKHYQDLELGRKGFNPNLETLNALAVALEVELFDLLYDREALIKLLNRSGN
jgi:transcriptional regulator with XRE-family HTH domain